MVQCNSDLLWKPTTMEWLHYGKVQHQIFINISIFRYKRLIRELGIAFKKLGISRVQCFRYLLNPYTHWQACRESSKHRKVWIHVVRAFICYLFPWTFHARLFVIDNVNDIILKRAMSLVFNKRLECSLYRKKDYFSSANKSGSSGISKREWDAYLCYHMQRM